MLSVSIGHKEMVLNLLNDLPGVVLHDVDSKSGEVSNIAAVLANGKTIIFLFSSNGDHLDSISVE